MKARQAAEDLKLLKAFAVSLKDITGYHRMQKL